MRHVYLIQYRLQLLSKAQHLCLYEIKTIAELQTFAYWVNIWNPVAWMDVKGTNGLPTKVDLELAKAKIKIEYVSNIIL